MYYTVCIGLLLPTAFEYYNLKGSKKMLPLQNKSRCRDGAHCVAALKNNQYKMLGKRKDMP